MQPPARGARRNGSGIASGRGRGRTDGGPAMTAGEAGRETARPNKNPGRRKRTGLREAGRQRCHRGLGCHRRRERGQHFCRGSEPCVHRFDCPGGGPICAACCRAGFSHSRLQETSAGRNLITLFATVNNPGDFFPGRRRRTNALRRARAPSRARRSRAAARRACASGFEKPLFLCGFFRACGVGACAPVHAGAAPMACRRHVREPVPEQKIPSPWGGGFRVAQARLRESARTFSPPRTSPRRPRSPRRRRRCGRSAATNGAFGDAGLGRRRHGDDAERAMRTAGAPARADGSTRAGRRGGCTRPAECSRQTRSPGAPIQAAHRNRPPKPSAGIACRNRPAKPSTGAPAAHAERARRSRDGRRAHRRNRFHGRSHRRRGRRTASSLPLLPPSPSRPSPLPQADGADRGSSPRLHLCAAAERPRHCRRRAGPAGGARRLHSCATRAPARAMPAGRFGNDPGPRSNPVARAGRATGRRRCPPRAEEDAKTQRGASPGAAAAVRSCAPRSARPRPRVSGGCGDQ